MISLLLLLSHPAPAQRASIAQTYTKHEYRIPMRDGVKLYTAVYVPKNADAKHPIMLDRTPYSAGPYGAEKFPSRFDGSPKFVENGYIFASQDVRGRYMSEGKWEEIRPINAKPGTTQTDESTDAYDTVEYLVKNVPSNNGRVGLWGISYPGFYAAAALANSHPAIKAVSPQAPVTEWFFGDDVHHNGAFFLQDNFDFYFGFGYDLPAPAEDHPNIEGFGSRPDAREFFLNLGAAINADKRFYKGRIPFWLDICNHEAYDEFWKARSTARFLTNVKAAVLTVGGLFDAEDMYGPWDVYAGIEEKNKGVKNHLVVGPWTHGGWAGGTGASYAGYKFGTNTSSDFRENIEFPFFDAYLRGDGKFDQPKVQVFDTGANVWRNFAEWPPTKETKPFDLYLAGNGQLSESGPPAGSDRYEVDPTDPIPYQPGVITRRRASYMGEDQTFLKDRKDILRYSTPVLDRDLRLCGPVVADLKLSTTGTDADFIVKVIDVTPEGAERLVRWEVMRGKFRKDFSKPVPFKPNTVDRVSFKLNPLFHTFLKGHKLMIHVQSSWFPLIDLNPNKFCNIYKAEAGDYQKATISIHRGTDGSRIRFGKL